MYSENVFVCKKKMIKLDISFTFDVWKCNSSFIIKFIYSEKATKILRNLPLTFDYSTYGQKLGEDFANFVAFLEYMNFTEQNENG